MKERIFLGSSKECLNIAEIIKRYFLNRSYECVMWSQGFFELNENTFDELIKKAVSFDYAIFVGGKDDLSFRLSNRSRKFAPRDNVYFELGLFTGVLSKYKTYMIADSSVNLATDMLGITMAKYENSRKNDELEASVKMACQKVYNKMKEEKTQNRIQMLPSSSLAYGYYENFLKPLGEKKLEITKMKLDDISYEVETIKLHVIMPETVEEDWKQWAEEFYHNNNLVQVEIGNLLRSYSVHIQPEELINNKMLVIWEVPQTIRSSFQAADMVTGGGFGSLTEMQINSRKKEWRNFKQTLENFIGNNVHVKNMVTIDVIDMSDRIDSKMEQ